MDSLRELRVSGGLTQAELARRSGVPQPNIAAYEAGRRVPTPATRRRLESALRPRPSDALARYRREVIDTLRRHKMRDPRVFGSVATGRDEPGSDADLLVDADPELDLLDLIDAAEELERLLGVAVDIVTTRSLRPGHEIAESAVRL